MLYDLNIPWTPSTDLETLEQTLTFSATQGYDVVALNHTLNPSAPVQVQNPLPKLNESATAPSSASSSPRKPTILHRVTIILSDATPNYRLPALSGAYDIVACRPQSEKAFSTACLSLTDVSIISLDLTVRYPFHFRPKPCMAAVARGLRFEICYSQVLTSSSTSSSTAPDTARARANFVSNLTSLVRATKGRGLIISSEARNALAVRAPADVVNLLAVWGLPNEKGMEALTGTPRGVVVNEGLKRTSYKGVVNIVEVGRRPGDEQKNKDRRDEAAKGAGAPAAAQKKKKNKDDGAAGQKRKNDEASASSQGQAQGQQPTSKRQAKKLKLAQRAAPEEST